jgi:hypothetical protein
VVFVFQAQHKQGVAALNAPASASVASDITNIPASAYAVPGTTNLQLGTTNPSATNAVQGLSHVTGGTPLTVDGKPTFVYIGGEFCPYCAAERWAIAASVSRFGTLTRLETTRSAADDGNYSTLSYVHAKYTSEYINFTPYEVENRASQPLQTPDAAAEASFKKYDSTGGVPFLSINNVYIGSSQYSPSLLGTMTQAQIAAAAHDPTTTLGKNILAASNVISAGICSVDGQKPSSVCTSPEVVAALAYLDVAGSAGSSTG